MNGTYVCCECGREYALEPGRYLCDACASLQAPDRPLRGLLEVRLEGNPPADWAALAPPPAPRAKGARTAPRAAAGPAKPRFSVGGPGRKSLPADPIGLLPVESAWFPPIPVGSTPLWAPDRLREETGFANLWIKDDSANPTGSLKDRASHLVAAFARKHGIARITAASTGNAGSSMAGVAAAAGLSLRLYLPASAPEAKRVQALQYGAELVTVDGNYDAAYDASLADAAASGALSRNTAHNPLTIEGKKTVALEIWLQLGGIVPDAVFVSAGDGVILSGVYKGFEDLVALGLATSVPRVVCVQAEGSSAIARALACEDGTPDSPCGFGPPVASSTLADSIAVDVPRGGVFALSRLRRHGGTAVTVSDGEILAAQRRLSSRAGLFAEPAAAAAAAGFFKAKGSLDPGATAVILVTGSGLKDVASAAKGVAAS